MKLLNKLDDKIRELEQLARQLSRGNQDLSVLKDSLLAFCPSALLLISRARRKGETPLFDTMEGGGQSSA